MFLYLTALFNLFILCFIVILLFTSELSKFSDIRGGLSFNYLRYS